MTEVSKSVRLESELAETVTRRAEAEGLSFTAFLVRALEEAIRNPEEKAKETSLGTLRGVKDEIATLTDVIKSSKMTHSELTESIIGLSRIAKELDGERKKALEVTSKSNADIEKSRVALREMIDTSVAVSQKCEWSVGKLEKVSVQIDTSIEQTMTKISNTLFSLEKQAYQMDSVFKTKMNEFSDKLHDGQMELRNMSRDYRRDALESTKQFVFSAAKKWHYAMLSVVGICIFAIVSAYGFSVYSSLGREAEIQKKLDKANVEIRDMSQQVLYSIQEACRDRVMELPQTYCAHVKGKKHQNPYR
jgi:hypothetical protein